MDKFLHSLLMQNPRQNIACLGFFSNYPVIDYYIENDTALVLGQSDHLWAHISSSSAKDLSKLLNEHHKKTKYYFSVEDWMIPLIQKFGNIDWIMTTNRYILNESMEIDPPKENIATLNSSLSSYIYENSEYQKFTSLEYIVDRLNNDISAGILLNNKLVAWGFTHDDGALGFLHVLKPYRKSGFALEILKFLINKRKREGKHVFVNIIPENQPAIKLVRKIGFCFDRRASWIKNI